MKILKGQKILVAGGRGKGSYKAIASADFDTENDEWYSVKVLQDVCGIQGYVKWVNGEEISRRKGIDRIVKIIPESEEAERTTDEE